jgi:nitronate monooxygenase
MTKVLESLLSIEIPIIQAPMAGSQGSRLAVAVSEAGGLGSLPCAMLSDEAMRGEVEAIRAATSRPFNLNFFCHAPPASTDDRAWRARLHAYYDELDAREGPAASRRPFDAEACTLVEALRPPVVSFHFGLPDEALLRRVRDSGAKILSSATTVSEARWLAEHGCDAIIAQGVEAGGHRGMFLDTDITRQVGTIALVPQIVDAVKLPVIAAGGIGDARGIVAALALGAAGVQLGSAYLVTPEAATSALHRQALASACDDSSVLTNVFSGRPARGIVNRLVREVGPMAIEAPAFPVAGGAVAPLRQKAEAKGSSAFSPLWTGQAVKLSRVMPAGELTRTLWAEATALRAAL